MLAEAQVTIDAPLAAVWAAIADIENSARTISGIEKIEIIDTPATGLVGLRWRETRILFGKPATVEKWITEAAGNEYYMTKADEQGFEYVSTKRISASGSGTIMTERHESRPYTVAGKFMALPMGFLFKRMMKKAILQDLNDVKAAVERPGGRP